MTNKISYSIIALLFVFGLNAGAQQSLMNSVDNQLLEKYIDLAIAYFPRKKVYDATEVKAKNDVMTATASIFDIFSAAYIYRPENKSAVDIQNPYNVNGPQVGININLGSLFSKPSTIKAAKANYLMSKAQSEEYLVMLKSEVRGKYYDYIQSVAQLKLSTQDAQDSRSLAQSVRNKFEKGEVTVDEYNESRVAESSATTLKIQAEVAYLKTKDALETLIGKKLSDVK